MLSIADVYPSANLVPTRPPAPHIHKNGTIFIVCQHKTLLRAESVHGPWTLVQDLTSVLDGSAGGVAGKYEDPFMWQVTAICDYFAC